MQQQLFTVARSQKNLFKLLFALNDYSLISIKIQNIFERSKKRENIKRTSAFSFKYFITCGYIKNV